MTAQFPDTVKYGRAGYDLIGVSGNGLFEPQAYGMEPVVHSTACYRGYICHYGIKENALVLAHVSISLENGAEGPTIHGTQPSSDEYWAARYEDLDMPLRFTGGLLLGRDFIRDMYVHMGFQKPHRYRDVKEIVLRDGKVVSVKDHSERMRQLRERDQRERERRARRARRHGRHARDELDLPDQDQIAKFVEVSFDLDYRTWSIFREEEEACPHQVSERLDCDTRHSDAPSLLGKLKRFLRWR